MDKVQKQAGKYDWLPQFMPGVARLIREKRQALGDAWVNECWKRGVVQGEPGWFFAAEGSLAVGTPIDAQPLLAYHQARRVSPTAVLLDMRKPEGSSHVA